MIGVLMVIISDGNQCNKKKYSINMLYTLNLQVLYVNDVSIKNFKTD